MLKNITKMFFHLFSKTPFFLGEGGKKLKRMFGYRAERSWTLGLTFSRFWVESVLMFFAYEYG